MFIFSNIKTGIGSSVRCSFFWNHCLECLEFRWCSFSNRWIFRFRLFIFSGCFGGLECLNQRQIGWFTRLTWKFLPFVWSHWPNVLKHRCNQSWNLAINHHTCARVDQLPILGMVIPPLVGILIIGIWTPTIRLMTIPRYMETMGVDLPDSLACFTHPFH